MKQHNGIRRALAVLAILGTALGMNAAVANAATGTPRIDLRVLVITDGSPWVEAIGSELTSEGVPTTVVNLNDSSRPTIDAGFLSGTLSDGTAEGHYQGVVLPGDYVPALTADEQSALATYETAFSVRQVDGYVYPSPNLGLNTPLYAGSLDATTATVTSAAKSGAFRYMNGTFTFEGTAGGSASYGYLAIPAANTASTSFTPYVTETIPGTTTTGVLAGVYTNAGREQLELSFGYNQYQLQYRFLAHGIVDWVTKGVHFGYWRNYLTVHIDDVFNADAIWSPSGNCTPGADTCPPSTPDTTPARMTASDVTAVANWEKSNTFTLDMLFNGGAEANFVVNGKDPLLTAFQQDKVDFRWVNHTYTHEFLGCQQDFTVTPWRCETDSAGNTLWVSSADVNSEIANNIKWAQAHGFPINRGELVAGEHSGTLILPQQPVDNPNFDGALGGQGVKYTGLDASREPAMRQVGAAYGLPRHPVDVYYNVSTVAEEIDEYNWIYTSAADGGSGICESTPGVSCIAPLDPSTGWSSYILPLQQKIMLGFVLNNDPRPFYMHQPNLTDDRLALQVVAGALATYRGVYSTNAPVVNGRMIATGDAMHQQLVWSQAMNAGTVGGYVQGNAVTITGPAGTRIPFTAPNGVTITGTDGTAFGAAYGGERSNYLTQLSTGTYRLTLSTSPYSMATTSTSTAKKTVAAQPKSMAKAPNTSAAKKAATSSSATKLNAPTLAGVVNGGS